VIAIAVLVYRIRIQIITSRLRDRAEERANERIRIARDLHDTLLQGFQGLMLSFHVAAQSVPNDSPARRMLDGALLKAVRHVIEGRDRVSRLRSESLEGVSLPDALRALGQELNARHALKFEVRILQTEIEIEPHVKDELFCIAREAITNSFRHANATEIGADVDYERQALSMTCHDNGCGIDQETDVPPPESCHYGVVGMIERARRIGASYRRDSSPGLGTKVIIRLPASRAYVQSGRISAWLRSVHRVDPIES
jgi:signal transduction histidine kinase